MIIKKLKSKAYRKIYFYHPLPPSSVQSFSLGELGYKAPDIPSPKRNPSLIVVKYVNEKLYANAPSSSL